MPTDRHLFRTSICCGRLLVLLGACLLACAALADAPTESQQRLLEDVKYLADDKLEGRGVGTHGLDLAAEYIRSQFAAAGLKVDPVAGDAFQTFSMITGSHLGEPNALAFYGPDADMVELKLDADFRTCSFGGTGAFEGQLVFCGYAIDHPQYNDFADVDVKGKTLIVLRRNPQQGNPHGPFSGPGGAPSREADLRTKMSNAYARGAAAVLLVNDTYSSRKALKDADEAVAKASAEVVQAAEAFVAGAEGGGADQLRQNLNDAVKRLADRRRDRDHLNPDELMAFGYGGNGRDESLPAMHLTQAACSRLLEAALGKSLEQIEAEIDAHLKPQSAVLPHWTVRGQATVKRVRADVKNVIAVLEGEGPLAEETIVIGAHYDHLGRGQTGSLAKPAARAEIHNGADDNASGTAALLELARRLASRERKLPRRLVFIAFTAEELGLIGSARYVENPVFPLDKTIAMFNMDMVGRLQDEKLTVFGTGTARQWQDQVERAGKEHGFELSLKPDGIGPSDHTSFYQKKVPVLHFFTGTHSDYHRPSDDWDRINIAGMSRVVDLIEALVVATAEASERPEYVQVQRPAAAARDGSRPYFGSIPDFGSDEPGYGIQGVAPGSPAALGGLKGGDRIVKLGEYNVGDLNDFDLALRKFKPGDRVEVVVVRSGQEVKLEVTLAKPQ